MFMKIIFACLALAYSCAAQSDAECGGNGGTDSFDDQGFAQYGAITGFTIWHGTTTCVIDGIQLRYGTVWGEAHNPKNNQEHTVLFADDERITGVSMDKRTHWGFEVICQITIFTNVGSYGPYCDHDCNNNRCGDTVQGSFSYISGRYGTNLDSLTWHASTSE